MCSSDLLQHATNPVDWHTWSDEAFQLARSTDRPVIVSIGYATCHWCHVMERESFENVDTAAFMNENFVNIKVDREERPDVDQIYMEACQIISGGGGWPLNCFLLPDGRPFFAGTYYPPQPAYQRPSWLQVLGNMRDAFQNKREIVEEQAAKMIEMIANSDKNYVKRPILLKILRGLFLQKIRRKIFFTPFGNASTAWKVASVVRPNFRVRCALNFYLNIIFILEMKKHWNTQNSLY